MTTVGMLKRGVGIAFVTQLALLFATAAWFRVVDLDTEPGHLGDESFYGIQAARLAAGESCLLHTASGNLVNPFLLGMGVPLHLVFEPSLVLLRVPAVLCGVLTILAAYLLASRVLDRPTALIAAAYLAALPAMVLYARLGLEVSQIPMAGLVAVYCAFRPSGLGLCAALVAALLVHPTNLFLVPIVLPVYVVRVFQEGADDPPRTRRRLIRVAAAVVVLVVAASALLASRDNVRTHVLGHLARVGELDWPHFLGEFARSYFTSTSVAAVIAPAPYKWAFWLVLSAAAVLGVPRLVAGRRWDRLALVGGLIGSVVLFHVAAGSHFVEEGGTRYNAVFLAPTALAFAVLVEAALPRPGRWPGLRRVGLGGVVAASWVVLWSVGPMPSQETIYRDDPYRVALALVDRDRGQSPERPGDGPTLILGDGFMVARPLEYLAAGRRDIAVVETFRLFDIWIQATGDDATVSSRTAQILAALGMGHYAMGVIDGPLDRLIASSFPADRIRRRTLKLPDGRPMFALVHVEPTEDGRPDPADAPTDAVAGAATLRR